LETDAAVSPDVTFHLSCPNRSQPYLSDGGWQGGPYAWKPRQIEVASTGARLLIGPEIVDRMWNDELVRIEIPDADYSAETSWEEIPASSVRPPTVEDDAEDSNRPLPHLQPQHQPQPPRHDPAPPVAAVAQTPIEPPVAIDPKPDDQKGEETKAEEQKAEEKKEAGEKDTDQGPKPAPLPRPWLIAAAAAGICFGMFLGYPYVAAAAAAPSSNAPAVPTRAVEEARRLLSTGERTGERLYQLGLELHGAAAAPRELGLQSIRRAAELGHAPANLWLGRMSDPARQDWVKARLRPDAAVALNAYARALESGAPDRNALCAHLRHQ